MKNDWLGIALVLQLHWHYTVVSVLASRLLARKSKLLMTSYCGFQAVVCVIFNVML